MPKYWAKHEPDEEADASCQKYDFTGDVELYYVLIYDPVEMCNLCLDKIKLFSCNTLVWILCTWHLWSKFRLFVLYHRLSPDVINPCVVKSDWCLSGDDDDVVGHLSPDECTLYLLIQTFTTKSFTDDEDSGESEDVVERLDDRVAGRKHQAKSKISTYWIKFVEGLDVQPAVNSPINED